MLNVFYKCSDIEDVMEKDDLIKAVLVRMARGKAFVNASGTSLGMRDLQFRLPSRELCVRLKSALKLAGFSDVEFFKYRD